MNMILDKITCDKKLRRMALEVAERNYQAKELILVGIKENGIFISAKIAGYLKERSDVKIDLIELELNKKKPGEIKLSKEIAFNDKIILLIDDVANSGRTMLYALKPMLQQLPREIQTLALVERTHKTFPVAVDYVGISVSTTLQDMIEVEVIDGQVMGAWLK